MGLSAEGQKIETDAAALAASLDHELTSFGPDPGDPANLALRYARCRRNCGLEISYSLDERFPVGHPRHLHTWNLSAARMSRCGMAR